MENVSIGSEVFVYTNQGIKEGTVSVITTTVNGSTYRVLGVADENGIRKPIQFSYTADQLFSDAEEALAPEISKVNLMKEDKLGK